jgi:hypothetical protein
LKLRLLLALTLLHEVLLLLLLTPQLQTQAGRCRQVLLRV